MGELHPGQLALIVKPRTIEDAQIMALAGDHHVIVAVITHLGGPPGAGGHHGAGNGQRIALAFLAAKAAAHPPHLDPHRRHRQVQRMRHLVLNLGRVLGGGMDQEIPAFQRQGRRDLTFQIEMLLPAHLEPALYPMRGGVDGAGGIALGPDHRPILEPAVCGQRVIHGQDRRLGVIGDLGQTRGLARGQMVVGRDQKQRHAQIQHRAGGNHRLVMRRRAAIGDLVKIVGAIDRDHAGGGAHG